MADETTRKESNLRVRDATLADAKTIADFNIAMALETEDKVLDADIIIKGIKHIFSTPDDGFYLVAECDDDSDNDSDDNSDNNNAITGCLLVTREWSDWRNGVFWWIQSVYVHPDFRRRGVFGTLYKAVNSRALAADNVCGIRLYVERGNIRAQQTYTSLGMADSNYLVFEAML